MPEWLNDSFQKMDLTVGLLTVRLAMALVLGCVVGGIFHWTRRISGADTPSLVPTLVLLTVLIAMVTLAIGDSVARAFSLVGALAIVRFRTVVEDTRDTAFVIFAVAVGMAVGAGFLMVPLVGIPFAALAAFLFRSRNDRPVVEALDFKLTVRIGVGYSPDALVRQSFEKHLDHSRIQEIVSARQGAALDLTYVVRLQSEDAALALVAELNGMEGVQNVELRK